MPRSTPLVCAVLTASVALGCAGRTTATGGAAQPDAAAAESALHARSQAFQAAEGAMDADRALAFWAADAIVQPAGAPQIQGREAIGALYRQFFTAMGVKALSGTPTHVALARSGDLAYESGINRIVFRSANGDLLDLGKYLLVWQRIDGEWYVVALSFTSDAAAPKPVSSGS
jgi:ketosteroid isomerase-like protein